MTSFALSHPGVDDATGLRRLLHVDLPPLVRKIKILSILAIIAGVQGFGLQFVLTQVGPGFATRVPGYLMYQDSFQNAHFGYGSAIGLVLFLFILAATYLHLRFVRSSTEYEAT